MRTRNAIERLADAGRPLLAEAESLVHGAEEERILARIVSSDRRPSARRRSSVVLVLGGAAVGGVLLAVALTRGLTVPPASTHGHPPVSTPGQHDVALTGARIEMAGYHFRTPAGFKATSDTSCGGTGPNPQVNGFTAAASAAGGCVAVDFRPGIGAAGASAPLFGGPAVPVAVGSYPGYYQATHRHPRGAPEWQTLFVALPRADGDSQTMYLVLFGQGLTEDQLIAVAGSGLSSVDFAPTTTTGTEGS